MGYEDVIQIATQGLVMVLMVSLPITIVSAAVGLLVSLVQAVTSLQDSTLSQGAKLLVVTLVIFLAAPWAGSLVMAFARQALLGATP